MNTKVFVVLLIFITNFKICQSTKYKNYALIKSIPRNVEDLRVLYNFETQKYIDLMFWERPYKLNREVTFVINPVDFELFKERANHFNLNYNVLLYDIQRYFDKQVVGGYRLLRFETFVFHHYHNLDDVYQWIADLAQQYNFVHLETIGKSAQGREIYAVSIKKFGAENKVIVEGGIHGHEWMSVSFVTYLINQLVESEKSGDKDLSLIAHAYEWLIVPVLNPDGYDYTHKKDRLWRKNRNNGTGDIGVDLNRNFRHSFGIFDSSNDPKDDHYCGPAPFSEPETSAFAKFVENNAKGLRYYFSFHAYGQMIVIPYEDRVRHVDNFDEMENFAKQAINKIYRYSGKKYKAGTMYDTTGTRVSGTSASWVKRELRVPYVYTLYLRDTGTLGYALPSDQILPTCKETMLAVTELMTARPRYIKYLYDSNSSKGMASCVRILFVSLGIVSVLK